MIWNTEARTNEKVVAVKQTALGDIIRTIVTLYLQLGWIKEADEASILTLIAGEEATVQRAESEGLDLKLHGRYRHFLIPSVTQWPLLHPTVIRPTLCHILNNNDDDWGYANGDYYGNKNEPLSSLTVGGKELPIAHGFTENCIGKIGFLVEDASAPGHNSKMPGSLLANMRWGDDRLAAWTEWQKKYPNANPQAMNYATYGLILLSEAATGNWDDALGRVGVYDFITQPFNAERRLCPFGLVCDDGARWNAGDAGADARYAVAAVVW